MLAGHVLRCCSPMHIRLVKSCRLLSASFVTRLDGMQLDVLLHVRVYAQFRPDSQRGVRLRAPIALRNDACCGQLSSQYCSRRSCPTAVL